MHSKLLRRQLKSLVAYIARMENGHSCDAPVCAPACQVKQKQATDCGHGCNGGTCDNGKMPSAPVPREADCSSIYCDPAAAAGRPMSSLERRMCFKCKTAKAEVGCWADLVLMIICTSGVLTGMAIVDAGVSETARAFVPGLFSLQLRENCAAHHTHKVPDRTRG